MVPSPVSAARRASAYASCVRTRPHPRESSRAAWGNSSCLFSGCLPRAFAPLPSSRCLCRSSSSSSPSLWATRRRRARSDRGPRASLCSPRTSVTPVSGRSRCWSSTGSRCPASASTPCSPASTPTRGARRTSWSSSSSGAHANPVLDADDLVQIDAYGNRPVLHPLEQVRRYVRSSSSSRGRSSRSPTRSWVRPTFTTATSATSAGCATHRRPRTARLFTKSGRGAWIDFLQSRLAPQPGRIAADQLLSSRIAPSRQLLAVAAAEIKNREQFVLLDEQQVAYSLVLRAVEKARAGNGKTVVLVTGGPGSGKSVIALSPARGAVASRLRERARHRVQGLHRDPAHAWRARAAAR